MRGSVVHGVVAALLIGGGAAAQPSDGSEGWSAGADGSVFRDCALCPEMVVIPAGQFTMGSRPSLDPAGEGPQHLVTVGPFALGRYEVTFAEWDACLAAAGCSHRPDDRNWGRGDRPVIDVSWQDAQEYVAWLSRVTGQRYRLPSESEWEYAARAGTTTARHWGDEIGSGQANCGECGSEWDGDATAPVGSFPANDFGLHDMLGNVWEWTQDCWNPRYDGAPVNGEAWESGSCDLRVLRGGAWSFSPLYIRADLRWTNTPDNRLQINGFRVARAP